MALKRTKRRFAGIAGMLAMVAVGVVAAPAQAETVNVSLDCADMSAYPSPDWAPGMKWSLCTTSPYELSGLDTDDVNASCPADRPYVLVEDLPWPFDVISSEERNDTNPHFWFRAYNANPFRGGNVSSRVACADVTELFRGNFNEYFDNLGIGNWDVLNWGGSD